MTGTSVINYNHSVKPVANDQVTIQQLYARVCMKLKDAISVQFGIRDTSIKVEEW